MKLTVFLTAALCGACHPGMSPVVPKTPKQRQMVGLLEKFDRWDYNGDGELSKKEVRIGIRGLKGKPQQVRYSAAEVLGFYDTNKNGKISLAEAQDGYRRAHEEGQMIGS
jgi:Ca2+-binding EF-hand superfamily protein